jgi:hypothetical protein
MRFSARGALSKTEYHSLWLDGGKRWSSSWSLELPFSKRRYSMNARMLDVMTRRAASLAVEAQEAINEYTRARLVGGGHKRFWRRILPPVEGPLE